MFPAQLAVKVRAYPELLLMCDYDGTLVNLAPRPELAHPEPPLLNLLQQLVSRPGLHLAIISGRTLADLKNLLPVPGLYLAGLHGSKVATPGHQIIDLRPPELKNIPWQEIIMIARKTTAGVPNLFVENKGDTVALHYRLSDSQTAEKALLQFQQNLEPFLSNNLEILHGHKVLEVRPRGLNKGLAVNYFTRQWPRAFPIYLGDDQTDEDAFAALPKKGLAVRIGKNRVASRARHFFDSPADVVCFLSEIALHRLP